MSPPLERFISSWSLNSADAASVLAGAGPASGAAPGPGITGGFASFGAGACGGFCVCSGVGTLTEVSGLIDPPTDFWKQALGAPLPWCQDSFIQSPDYK